MRSFHNIQEKAITGNKGLSLTRLVNWQNLQKKLFRDKQFGDKGGKTVIIQIESPVPDLTKVTKAKRF
jgi:hypothetical protein